MGDKTIKMNSKLFSYGRKAHHSTEAEALALLPLIEIDHEIQAHTWE